VHAIMHAHQRIHASVLRTAPSSTGKARSTEHGGTVRAVRTSYNDIDVSGGHTVSTGTLTHLAWGTHHHHHRRRRCHPCRDTLSLSQSLTMNDLHCHSFLYAPHFRSPLAPGHAARRKRYTFFRTIHVAREGSTSTTVTSHRILHRPDHALSIARQIISSMYGFGTE